MSIENLCVFNKHINQASPKLLQIHPNEETTHIHLEWPKNDANVYFGMNYSFNINVSLVVSGFWTQLYIHNAVGIFNM